MFDKSVFEKIMKYCENTKQPEGLSMETIEKVSNYFKEHFDIHLPQGYIDFLHVMNGFSYNDHSIFCCYNEEIENNYPRYASLDLATFNTNFYECTDITNYIILGKSSMDYIGYIKSTHKYVIMTNGTMRHLKEFDTFFEMIINFLELS